MVIIVLLLTSINPLLHWLGISSTHFVHSHSHHLTTSQHFYHIIILVLLYLLHIGWLFIRQKCCTSLLRHHNWCLALLPHQVTCRYSFWGRFQNKYIWSHWIVVEEHQFKEGWCMILYCLIFLHFFLVHHIHKLFEEWIVCMKCKA